MNPPTDVELPIKYRERMQSLKRIEVRNGREWIGDNRITWVHEKPVIPAWADRAFGQRFDGTIQSKMTGLIYSMGAAKALFGT